MKFLWLEINRSKSSLKIFLNTREIKLKIKLEFKLLLFI